MSIELFVTICVAIAIGAAIGIYLVTRPTRPATRRSAVQQFPSKLPKYQGKPTRGDDQDWARADLD